MKPIMKLLQQIIDTPREYQRLKKENKKYAQELEKLAKKNGIMIDKDGRIKRI